MSQAIGRWTGINTNKAKATAGADPVVVVVPTVPTASNGWRTFVIIAAVAIGIYVLSPRAVEFYKTGRIPGHPDDHRNDGHDGDPQS